MEKIPRNIIIGLALIIIVLVITVIIWFCLVSYSNTHPDYGENIGKVDWLPEGATNISYYKSYSFTAYEFDIDEKGFKSWIDRFNDCELKIIKEPQTIKRYNTMLFSDDKPWDEVEKEGYAEVSEGYYHLTTFGESGGRFHIVYDSLNGRVYYRLNPR